MANWSTDTNYSGLTGAQAALNGSPTKVEPSAGQKASGFVPGDPSIAQHFNWLANSLNTTDVQNFTSTGTYTKPPGTIIGHLILLVAGGGGGGGGEEDGTNAFGGAGGGGGQRRLLYLPGDTLPDGTDVTIGAGGAGGTAGTTPTNGSDGGDSEIYFTDFRLFARGGGGGEANLTDADGGGIDRGGSDDFRHNPRPGPTPADLTSIEARAAEHAMAMMGAISRGGGAGDGTAERGEPRDNNELFGGSGFLGGEQGFTDSTSNGGGGGGGGAVAGVDATDGGDPSASASTGGKGGKGYGAGGGGGGAVDTGTHVGATAGAGGAGSAGYCQILTFLGG